MTHEAPQRIELRRATTTDDEFVYRLHRRTLGEVIEQTWGPWDDEVQREFHRRWFDPARLEIVLVDGVPAGVVDAGVGADGNYYVGRIAIAPEFQNRGLGTEIIDQLVARARKHGAPAVELHVLKKNRACALYERRGFRVVADEPPKLRMRKDL